MRIAGMSVWVLVLVFALAGAVSFGAPAPAAQEEPAIVFPWYVCPGLGFIDYEGDEEVRDGYLVSLRLGYDFNDWWAVEGLFTLAPDLEENTVGHTFIDANGNVVHERISRVKNPEDRGFDSTYAAGLALEGLFHFTRWDRVDPYLAIGGGFTWYGDKVNGENFDPAIRVGGGIMYHINDEWAVRADWRSFLAGNDIEANSIIDGGLVWTWGARVAPRIGAVSGPGDMDADGLFDDEEVNRYRTDPRNPDTDFDGLKDGEEVHSYRTDPLKRDTDGGLVADGHEVIEDHTDPLNPNDDVILFELNIEFDYNKADLKAVYFPQLDIIGKVLKRNPGATARVEGHADRSRKSGADYNKKLSLSRAEAVREYLSAKAGIEKSRTSAIGYGFDRPKALNNPETGNPVNRRVEVYIKGANRAGESDLIRSFEAARPPLAPTPDTK